MGVRRRATKLPNKMANGLHLLAKDFLTSSSIHGAALVVAAPRRTILERCWWMVLMSVAVGGAISVSLSTWSRFADSPTVTSVERDHWSWRTPFPAATVCPRGFRGNDERILRAAKWAWRRRGGGPSEPVEESGTLMLSFLRAFGSANLASLSTLKPFAQSQDLLPPAEDLMELFLMLQPNFTFEGSASGLSYAGPVKRPSTSPPWHATLNEAGLCYVVFSGVDQLVEDTGNRSPDGTAAPDVAAGNPLDGDAHVQLVEMSHGYEAFFHSPWDDADVLSWSLASSFGHYANVDLAAAAIITTEEARTGLGVAQRKCRFRDEAVGDTPAGGGATIAASPGVRQSSSSYSFNACRSNCRASLARRLCSCHAEHLFGRIATTQGDAVPCGISGLICLSQHEDLLIKLPSSIDILSDSWSCDCLPTCEDVNYVAVRSDVIPWPLGNSLKWGISKYPRTRHKRDVLFGFSDLLGSMGGTAGLFLGCSLLSAVELVYFATLRAFWALVGRHNTRRVHFVE